MGNAESTCSQLSNYQITRLLNARGFSCEASATNYQINRSPDYQIIKSLYLYNVQDEYFKKQWELLLTALEPRFGGDLDVQAILFIIGLQELGHGFRVYGKDEKMNIMHVAICSLLEPFGYYDYEGRDADNWPHWKATAKLPNLKPGQQQRLMQEAIIEYFEKGEVI